MDLKLSQRALYKKTLNGHYKKVLKDIIIKASLYYSRTTWGGWVDHGERHIQNVVKRLDELIPTQLHDVISTEESFVLFASVILHDIGMCASSTDLEPLANGTTEDLKESYNKIRVTHGNRGAKIAEKLLEGLVFDERETLVPIICDIIKNHHGEFTPDATLSSQMITYPAQALLVRLADNLDFGKDRAPSHLCEYIGNVDDQKKYWKEQQTLKAPIVKKDLFRIHLTGKVANLDFITQLKKNFEDPIHTNCQMAFFSRIPQFKEHSYIIWDRTKKNKIPGEEVSRDPRPNTFNRMNLLEAAHALYNIGHYKNALEHFETKDNQEIHWEQQPHYRFIYQYLQTLNKLGRYKDCLEISERINQTNFSEEISLGISYCRGIAFFNLNQCQYAYTLFLKTIQSIKSTAGLFISIADIHIWCAISQLPNLINEDNHLLKKGYKNIISEHLEKSSRYFKSYEKDNPQKDESHYRGRYYGFMVYYLIYVEESNDWNKIIDYAHKAYGGAKNDNRVVFGIMSGKYTEALAQIERFKDTNEEEALICSVNQILEVINLYKKLYGDEEHNIPTIWDKIYLLAQHIILECETSDYTPSKQETIEKLLNETTKHIDQINNDIPKFLPLN